MNESEIYLIALKLSVDPILNTHTLVYPQYTNMYLKREIKQNKNKMGLYFKS